MKLSFALGLNLLIGLTAYGKVLDVPRDIPMGEIWKNSFCEFKILKTFRFEKGEMNSLHGTFDLKTEVDSSAIREARVGRGLSLKTLGSNVFIFSDPFLSHAVIRNQSGNEYLNPNELTIAEIENYSNQAVKVICHDEEVVEI